MRKSTSLLAVLLVTALVPLVASAQINSAASGSWADGATWVGGNAPTSTDDVIIQSGHTISIDGTAPECRNLSFGGNDALIDMNANGLLTIYGDFTLFSTSHIVFSAGWSATSAYVKFAGSAVQTLRGFNPAGGSTSFRDVIVDKDGGKLTTDASAMRLGIQNSLEIVNGLFELAADDDIEGRWASSGSFTSSPLPNIIVQAGGEFDMVDAAGVHHIRSGVGLPIGTVTIYGKATFIDASTYKINLTAVNVENGGKIITSTGMGVGEFECGPLHIKDGGELEHYTTSDCWGPTCVLTLDAGGLFDTKSSTTIFPPAFVNNGTVRYSRDGVSDQTIVDMDYMSLEISLDEVYHKNWDLAADRSIFDRLTVNYGATLVLSAAAPQIVTVNQMLYLTSGLLDNSDVNASLAMTGGTLIQRATGVIATAPVFDGQVDLRYTSTAATVFTGPEVPVTGGVLRDFTLDGTMGVNLSSGMDVSGVCTISGSDLVTGSSVVTLGPAATLVEADDATIIGTVTTTRNVAQSVTEAFGGIGLEITAAGGAPGQTVVTRTTGMPSNLDGTEGIERSFDVSAANNAGLDAAIVVHYDESELNSIPENALAVFANNGSGWALFASTGDNVANTVSASGLDAVAVVTLGVEWTVPSLLQSVTVVPTNGVVDISWRLYEAIQVGDFSVYRSEGSSRDAVALNLPVESTGDFGYRLIDNTCATGSTYSYRVDITDESGSWTLFESEPVEIQRYGLHLAQNYPNPFNPSTEIKYSVTKAGHVTLDVYDIAGRRVARLVDTTQPAGTHSTIWRGLDDAGAPVSSGTYFYRMAADNVNLVKKMMLVR